MQHRMLLVCHAADGHFADGNRMAVQRILEQAISADWIMALAPDHFEMAERDNAVLELHAPGLDGERSFHRIEITVDESALNNDVLNLIYDVMMLGGFGLMKHLDACSFIVTSPQQVMYFPWLPEPPLLIGSATELAQLICEAPREICA